MRLSPIIWGKDGFQTESWPVGTDWRSATPTYTPVGVAIGCFLAAASSGWVHDLTCHSTTTFLGVHGSLSMLRSTLGESPSAVHPVCRCAAMVTVKVISLSTANVLCTRSSDCAETPGAAAMSTGIGTICLCEKRIALYVPYTVPFAPGSFLRIPRISSSLGHACPQSRPIRNKSF